MWAATSAAFDELEFTEERGLRWIDSPDSEHDARRGFCAECGSSLFWQVPGSRDGEHCGRLSRRPDGHPHDQQIWAESAGDYYELDERSRATRRRGE